MTESYRWRRWMPPIHLQGAGHDQQHAAAALTTGSHITSSTLSGVGSGKDAGLARLSTGINLHGRSFSPEFSAAWG